MVRGRDDAGCRLWAETDALGVPLARVQPGKKKRSKEEIEAERLAREEEERKRLEGGSCARAQ